MCLRATTKSFYDPWSRCLRAVLQMTLSALQKCNVTKSLDEVTTHVETLGSPVIGHRAAKDDDEYYRRY